jgi:hypothetical protein
VWLSEVFKGSSSQVLASRCTGREGGALDLPKLVAFDFFTPYLISTHTTGVPQLKILKKDSALVN